MDKVPEIRSVSGNVERSKSKHESDVFCSDRMRQANNWFKIPLMSQAAQRCLDKWIRNSCFTGGGFTIQHGNFPTYAIQWKCIDHWGAWFPWLIKIISVPNDHSLLNCFRIRGFCWICVTLRARRDDRGWSNGLSHISFGVYPRTHLHSNGRG